MTYPHNLQNVPETVKAVQKQVSNIVSAAGNANSNNVKDNQNNRKKHDFYWIEKEIERLLENFYFSRFLVSFHVVHTLRKVFRDCFTPLY